MNIEQKEHAIENTDTYALTIDRVARDLSILPKLKTPKSSLLLSFIHPSKNIKCLQVLEDINAQLNDKFNMGDSICESSKVSIETEKPSKSSLLRQEENITFENTRKHMMSVTVSLEKCDLHKLKASLGYDKKKFIGNCCDFQSINESKVDLHVETVHDTMDLNVHDKAECSTEVDIVECSTSDSLYRLNLKCSKCSYVGLSILDKQKHIRSHHEETLKCKSCDYLACDEKDEFLHQYTHKMEKLKCHLCNFIPSSYEENALHDCSTYCNQTINCKECDFQTKSINEYQNHSKQHEQMNCSHFSIQAKLNEHDYENHEKLNCESCDDFYNFKSELKKHQIHLHSMNQKQEQKLETYKEPAFSCSSCGFQCKTSKRYKIHVQEKHKIKTEVSRTCSTFDTEPFQEKLYQCKLCEYKSRYKGNLNKHMVVHSKKRPYKCKISDLMSKHFSGLETHMRGRRKKRPHKCKLCNFTANQLGNLKTHMLKHTGVKPFQCILCDYKSTQSGNLTSHIKRNH